MPQPPLLLYSANTWLAYSIAESFYGGEHYVWCTPYFTSRAAPPHVRLPPTSAPASIYRSLAEEVRAGDRHSAKIRDNKLGISRGVKAKLQDGTIDDRQGNEIMDIVGGAEISDFRPLVYVIPRHLVAGVLEPVAIEERAHPLSAEFLIERLPRMHFDVIDFDE
jgi:hypothetical protein